MTVQIMTLGESADYAASCYEVWTDGLPKLVPTGIHAVDSRVRGLGPGTFAVLGGLDGVGKSRVCRMGARAAQRAGYRHGIVVLEDPPDVVGGMAWGEAAAVDALRIRTKTGLTAADKAQLRAGRARLDADETRVAYAIGAGVPVVRDAMRALVDDHGCQLVWLDYVHAIPGTEDNAVLATACTELHACAAELGVPLIAVAQLTPRYSDGGYLGRPRASWLRGSRVLQFKSRLTLILAANKDETITGSVEKSTFGGAGATFRLRTTPTGSLQEIDE